LKPWNLGNGTQIAIEKVPVMYRLLEKTPASPMNADARQEQMPEKRRPLNEGNYRPGSL
jgi:hypothetical protein